MPSFVPPPHIPYVDWSPTNVDSVDYVGDEITVHVAIPSSTADARLVEGYLLQRVGGGATGAVHGVMRQVRGPSNEDSLIIVTSSLRNGEYRLSQIRGGKPRDLFEFRLEVAEEVQLRRLVARLLDEAGALIADSERLRTRLHQVLGDLNQAEQTIDSLKAAIAILRSAGSCPDHPDGRKLWQQLVRGASVCISGIASTAMVVGAGYYGAQLQANATIEAAHIQSDATIEAAHIQAAATDRSSGVTDLEIEYEAAIARCYDTARRTEVAAAEG